MPATIIVGSQWGDEGKGKITDFLADRSEVVVRSQGGNNAGHTVISNGAEYKLHLIPSGILNKDSLNIVGNGVVVDLSVLLGEMEQLQERGISFQHFYLSDRAHLIMPYHKLIDGLEESAKGEDKIGTTKRGIGPAYSDKVNRVGIRICDLLEFDEFQRKLHVVLKQKNLLLEKIYGEEPLDEGAILKEFADLAERIRPYVADTSVLVNESLKAGKKVLFEGAQAVHLDIDHGTYPFVTSSSPCAGGALTGTGVGPTKIDAVVGVAKAYTTRVGSGPFPTELHDVYGETLRKIGGEYGVTTGRPRRCGWLDGVVLRYSARVCGMTDLALTKLDVLDQLSELKLCVAYRYGGQIMTEFPASLDAMEQCEPIYETLPGWQQDISSCRNYEELPENAKAYIKRVEELTETSVSIVAVGPDRQQTILRKEF
ncbi:MAG TPA: adenylosuccinate synthase [Clostridiales bacterium]|nr:adenylosuccinate synthase [Clostridiales bacterium]